ncbi:mandelate racemase/muconate lactonizing enzyme family protein [Microlunatus speluncae]|uniref:mandelate racemase/muconate lactonizing enzyme family protein n=1 Tax=Microlunatus speluncae TaxID=2594267 RepID=UPI00126683CF|nr:mandelate racemase/muconate lactonizing enzyme family protein [Microlunatus speluncae]
MTKITNVECRQVDLEPETVRTDASQQFLKQETVLVTVQAADGCSGTGYTYTIGTGGSSVLALLRDHLADVLIGADSRNLEQLWQLLINNTRATTVGAITSLAMAAVDIALWDLAGKRYGQPVWRLAGGAQERLPVYDTEGGWIHLPADDLVRNAIAAQTAGHAGVKIKVGKSLAEDVERLAAVRAAVGPAFEIMVDANQSFTAAEATRRAASYESLGIAWFEEPLPADDLSGHARLARCTSVPIAVGESLYSGRQFAEYLAAGAASIIQVDAARVGGITPWLKVAHTAESFNVDVAPHFLMELHVSLACAVPNGRYVEHIPQLGAVTRTGPVIENGWLRPPDAPGIGIDWDPDALDNLRVA